MSIRLGAPSLSGLQAASQISAEFGAKTFPLQVKISNLVPNSFTFPEIGLYLKPTIGETAEFGIVTVESIDKLKRFGSSASQVAEFRGHREMVQLEEYVSGEPVVEVEQDINLKAKLVESVRALAAPGSFSRGIVTDGKELAVSDQDSWTYINHKNIVMAGGMDNTGVNDVGDVLRGIIAKIKQVASDTNRVKLVIPPGYYSVSGQLDLGRYIDLDMSGAKLVFTDAINQPGLIIGDSAELTKYGSYLGINLACGWLFYGSSGHKFNDYNLTGLEIRNTTDSKFDIRNISGFTTCIRLVADGASKFCAYNEFHIKSLVSCKVGINIHSNNANCWVNENTFYEMNFQPTSNLVKYGSTYGIRYTAVAGGYKGHNQNILIKGSFQQSQPTAISSGASLNYLERYYNPTTRLEYKVVSNTANMTAGSMFPTHTSGIAADNNGINWEYVGPCRCAAVFHDGAGGDSNRIVLSRYEGGFGPFMIARDVSANSGGARANANIYEVYGASGNNWLKSDLEENCYDNSPAASAGNEIISYSHKANNTITLGNLHRKAVGSSSGVTVPGFEHGANSGATLADFSTGIEILADGLWLKSSTNGIALMIATDNMKRVSTSFISPSRANSGRVRVRCLDAARAFFSDLTTIARAFINGASASTTEITLPGPTSSKRSIGFHEDTKFARIFFQGETTTKTIISSIALTVINSVIKSGNEEIIEISNRKPLDPARRYSYGTPTIGFFETQGEQISNLNTSTGQSLFWIVKTAGALANAWAIATAYVEGSLVSDSGNVYRAIADHTSGATFAGDSANWALVGPVAVLVASTQTY